jgi:hypothetical protein
MTRIAVLVAHAHGKVGLIWLLDSEFTGVIRPKLLEKLGERNWATPLLP